LARAAFNPLELWDSLLSRKGKLYSSVGKLDENKGDVMANKVNNAFIVTLNLFIVIYPVDFLVRGKNNIIVVFETEVTV